MGIQWGKMGEVVGREMKRRRSREERRERQGGASVTVVDRPDTGCATGGRVARMKEVVLFLKVVDRFAPLALLRRVSREKSE